MGVVWSCCQIPVPFIMSPSCTSGSAAAASSSPSAFSPPAAASLASKSSSTFFLLDFFFFFSAAKSPSAPSSSSGSFFLVDFFFFCTYVSSPLDIKTCVYAYLLGEISEHVGDLFDLLVIARCPTRQFMFFVAYTQAISPPPEE